MPPPKYKDVHKKTEDLLNKDFYTNNVVFDYSNNATLGENDADLDFKIDNDPLSSTGAAEAKVKYYWGGDKNKNNEAEGILKSDGSRTLKLAAKKLVTDTKLKLSHTYNPWLDIFDVNVQADYARESFHSTVTAHYGKKQAVEVTATYEPVEKWLVGVNGFFDIRKKLLTTYNALVQFHYFNKTCFSLEHQSVPGGSMTFGNWIFRTRIAEENYKIGLKGAFEKETQSAIFELGGKHRFGHQKHTLRWKVDNRGIGQLGTKMSLYNQGGDSLILRLGMMMYIGKKNIFEDEGSWGIGLKYKHKTFFNN